MDEFPVLEVAQQAKARMEMREENEQRVFAAGIDPEEAADCSCECCPPRTSQEPNDYCCRSLFTFDTVRNGTKLRDGLVANMEEFGQHSCIIKDPLFRNYILTQNVSMSIDLRLLPNTFIHLPNFSLKQCSQHGNFVLPCFSCTVYMIHTIDNCVSVAQNA